MARTLSSTSGEAMSPSAVITWAWNTHEPALHWVRDVSSQAVLAIQRGEEGRGIREAEQRSVRYRLRVLDQLDQVLQQVHGTEAAPREPDRLELRVGPRPPQVLPPLCDGPGGVARHGQDVLADHRLIAPPLQNLQPTAQPRRLDRSRRCDDGDPRTGWQE